MAKKYVTQEEAARILGVTVEQLAEMRMRQQIYGLKDGPNWKFKPEDVERVLRDRNEKADEADQLALEEQRRKEQEQDADADSGEDVVLLSEFELGESGPSTSSTVIGKPVKGRDPGDSDIRLGGGSDGT